MDQVQTFLHDNLPIINIIRVSANFAGEVLTKFSSIDTSSYTSDEIILEQLTLSDLQAAMSVLQSLVSAVQNMAPSTYQKLSTF